MLVVGPLHLAQGGRPASWLQVSNAVHVLVQQKLMPTQVAGKIIAVRADQWNADEDLTESTFLGD